MVSTFKECKMHHELQSIDGNPRAERRRPNLGYTELLDLQQFGVKDAGIYVSTPSPRHYQANVYAWGGSSADNKVPFDSNSDAWNPFKRRDPFFPHQYSYNHDVFSSRPVYQSYSSVSGYADSGYESQAGADAQSLMSVPSHVESAHEFSGGPFEDCGPSYVPVIKENPLRCNKCSWTGKTQSQKKKHDARHAKAHRCEEFGCDAGFGTKNDLERHRKAVHSKSPRCGPADRYKCFGKNCPHSEKVWPRLDNFKAHLDRKHNDETQEELIARSRAWYETWKKGASSVDTITPLKTLNNPGTYFDIFPENSRLNQTGNEPVFDKSVPAEIPIWQAGHDPAKKDPQPNRKLPGVQTVLNPIMSESTDSISGDRGACTPEQRILPSVQAFERGVALMQALTVATLQNNGNQLNAGENASFSAMDISRNMPGMHAEKLPNISQLSNEETKFCLNMISKMHSQLTLQQASSSSKSEASSSGTKFENNEAIAIHGAEKGGHKCPNCPKTFSKQSLFKKHQKRHDKPYGCTFAGCYGEFGSKADWKRHESMQHYHVQCFRCSLPRRGGNNNNKHAECASLFFHEDDFIQHLTETHQCMGERNIRREIDKSRIGAYDHQSKFYYWCGFCRQIKLVEKRGVEAWNERFDHIEIEHFRKGENIKTWVPAKGHTMKGARKKRDKLRKGSNNNRTSKRPGKRPLEDVEQQSDSNNNGRGDGDEVTTYEVCSTSEDDTDMEAKQLSNNYKLKHKIRRVHRSDEELACVFCCHCKDGPQTLVSESCMRCSHIYCDVCPVENPVGQDMDFVPVTGQ